MEPIDFICFKCKHYASNNDDGLEFGCRAFPDGIPDYIAYVNKHNTPLKPRKPKKIWSTIDPPEEGQTGDFVYTPVDGQ